MTTAYVVIGVGAGLVAGIFTAAAAELNEGNRPWRGNQPANPDTPIR